jgi:hypothetical protein
MKEKTVQEIRDAAREKGRVLDAEWVSQRFWQWAMETGPQTTLAQQGDHFDRAEPLSFEELKRQVAEIKAKFALIDGVYPLTISDPASDTDRSASEPPSAERDPSPAEPKGT